MADNIFITWYLQLFKGLGGFIYALFSVNIFNVFIWINILLPKLTTQHGSEPNTCARIEATLENYPELSAPAPLKMTVLQ